MISSTYVILAKTLEIQAFEIRPLVLRGLGAERQLWCWTEAPADADASYEWAAPKAEGHQHTGLLQGSDHNHRSTPEGLVESGNAYCHNAHVVH